MMVWVLEVKRVRSQFLVVNVTRVVLGSVTLWEVQEEGLRGVRREVGPLVLLVVLERVVEAPSWG